MIVGVAVNRGNGEILSMAKSLNRGKHIRKTYLYNFDPLKPHFYIVKLGFTGVYIIFLISAQKHRLWVLVRTASSSTHNLCFEQKYEKYQSFLSENFQFLEVKFSISLRKHAYSNILKISPQETESFQVKLLIFFIFLLKKIDCGYSLEPPR